MIMIIIDLDLLMTVKLKVTDSEDSGLFLASQMYSPLSVSSKFLMTKMLLDCGPLGMYVC